MANLQWLGGLLIHFHDRSGSSRMAAMEKQSAIISANKPGAGSYVKKSSEGNGRPEEERRTKKDIYKKKRRSLIT